MFHDQESTAVVSSISINDFASAWGSQEAPGDYLIAIGKKNRLLEEIRYAVLKGDLKIFDSFLGGERSYRASESDEHALTRGYIRVLPASLNAWLRSIGLATMPARQEAEQQDEPKPADADGRGEADVTAAAESEDEAGRAKADHRMPIEGKKCGVSRDEILVAFPPLIGQTNDQWGNMLSDVPKWLEGARIDAGRRGISARWDPAQLAICRYEKGDMTLRSLEEIIRRHFPDYLDDWKSKAALLC